jgi:DNA polymerase-3 subunit epsilon
MRLVVLDTETTGLDHTRGDRIIEIGCVELLNRRLTGHTYHQYINPQCAVSVEAQAIHGITDVFLADKPIFAKVAQELLQFIAGAELVMHNAPFDAGFLDHELALWAQSSRQQKISLDQHCQITDSLMLARAKHPGQKNNLDALCRRYGINNSHRELHGALLDAKILADVYLAITGGQTDLKLQSLPESVTSLNQLEHEQGQRPVKKDVGIVIRASVEEQAAHQRKLEQLQVISGGRCEWLTAF